MDLLRANQVIKEWIINGELKFFCKHCSHRCTLKPTQKKAVCPECKSENGIILIIYTELIHEQIDELSYPTH
jgi:Zn finger protein HypA/HybF involved in hydrogenase expression